VQNAKDTFYEVLRGRLAAVNPERTVVVRGMTRPGVLVVENELVSALTPADCFLLRWRKASCDAHGALPAITMVGEISYATAGTTANGGIDRGRVLAAMDAELVAMVGERPQRATKMDYTDGSTGGVPMATQVWWSNAIFGEATATGGRMERTATVQVMSFEEAGEM